MQHRYNGYSLGHVNAGNGTIWLDEVSCHGMETNIASCSRSIWGSSYCQHEQDVSVRCTRPANAGI